MGQGLGLGFVFLLPPSFFSVSFLCFSVYLFVCLFVCLSVCRNMMRDMWKHWHINQAQARLKSWAGTLIHPDEQTRARRASCSPHMPHSPHSPRLSWLSAFEGEEQGDGKGTGKGTGKDKGMGRA
jgi:hypothetical protein